MNISQPVTILSRAYNINANASATVGTVDRVDFYAVRGPICTTLRHPDGPGDHTGEASLLSGPNGPRREARRCRSRTLSSATGGGTPRDRRPSSGTSKKLRKACTA